MPYLKTGIGATPIFVRKIVKLYVPEPVDCKIVRKHLRDIGIGGMVHNGEGGCSIQTSLKNALTLEKIWNQ